MRTEINTTTEGDATGTISLAESDEINGVSLCVATGDYECGTWVACAALVHQCSRGRVAFIVRADGGWSMWRLLCQMASRS